jgi:hypothetical protein
MLWSWGLRNLTIASTTLELQHHHQHDSVALSPAWLGIYIASWPSHLGKTIASTTRQRHHATTWSSTSTLDDFSGKQTCYQLIPVLLTIMFGSRANANVPMRFLAPSWSIYILNTHVWKLWALDSKDLIRELGATPNRCTYTVPLFDQFGEKALNNSMPEYLVLEIEYSANSSLTWKV